MKKRLTHIVWAVLFFLSQPCWGQVNSRLGRFQADYAKGCAPLTVNVNNISGNTNALYLYDGEICDPTSPVYDPTGCTNLTPTVATQHTYNTPGVYSIVEFDLLDVPREDVLIIEVLPPQPPEFNVILCNNNGVAVNITDTYYDQFLIDYGDGSPPTANTSHNYASAGTYLVTVSGYFTNGPVNCGSSNQTISTSANLTAAVFTQLSVQSQSTSNGSIDFEFSLSPNTLYELQGTANGTAGFPPITTITGTNYTHTTPFLNTVDSIYCFRIAAIDPCGGPPVFSDTLCSIVQQVVSQNGQNQIDWQTITTGSFTDYTVNKNGAILGNPITDPTTTDITDSEIICDINYCYQTITTIASGGRSISAEQCVTGFNTTAPPRLNHLTATVIGNSVELNWEENLNFDTYQVFRSTNNGPFVQLGRETELPFQDQNLRPQVDRYCYYITYSNSCGYRSEPSETACAIQLSGSNTQNNRYFQLMWTPYSGWEQGVAEYQIEIVDETGSTVGPPISVSGISTTYSDLITPDKQISQYRVIAISNETPVSTSISNIIRVNHPLKVFVPNSFTPNNDGLNDTFNAKGLFIQDFSMEIYNRWGELLFHTTDLEQGWDGYYRGTLSTEGTYVYNIIATDSKGRRLVKKGSLHLLRKGF